MRAFQNDALQIKILISPELKLGFLCMLILQTSPHGHSTYFNCLIFPPSPPQRSQIWKDPQKRHNHSVLWKGKITKKVRRRGKRKRKTPDLKYSSYARFSFLHTVVSFCKANKLNFWPNINLVSRRNQTKSPNNLRFLHSKHTKPVGGNVQTSTYDLRSFAASKLNLSAFIFEQGNEKQFTFETWPISSAPWTKRAVHFRKGRRSDFNYSALQNKYLPNQVCDSYTHIHLRKTASQWQQMNPFKFHVNPNKVLVATKTRLACTEPNKQQQQLHQL